MGSRGVKCTYGIWYSLSVLRPELLIFVSRCTDGPMWVDNCGVSREVHRCSAAL